MSNTDPARIVDVQGGLVAAHEDAASRLSKSANLADIFDRAAARENLGLGGVWRSLALSSVEAALTGTTTETVLATISIPGGTIGANGALRVTSLWSYPNNVNTKTLRVRLGGLASTAALIAATATTTAAVEIQRTLRNRNSQSAQVCFQASNIASYGTGSSVTTMAVDTSISQDLVMTGQLANAADTLKLESFLVEVLFKA